MAVVLIAALEVLQFWAPGRHARLEDFAVDALTACLGFFFSAAAEWVMLRFGLSSGTVTHEGPAE